MAEMHGAGSVFAGHDACPLMPAMVALGIWDGSWPDYATCITLEVVTLPESPTSKQPTHASKEHFVRCFYNGQQREIQGCSRVGDGLCPLSTFLANACARCATTQHQIIERHARL
jgi:hypothetical protein